MGFDWSKVEGYADTLTADEKIALLDNYEEPKPASAPNGYIAKSQFDKLASEMAATKRQLRAKLSEDEAKEADRAAEYGKMQEELESLRKEKRISTFRANYLAQGYDENLAAEAAAAMADGDTEAVFAAMKKHSANYEKALRAEILKGTDKPPAGDDGEGAKKKKIDNDLRANFGLPPR